MWNAASRQFFLNQAKPYPYATGGDYVYLYEDTETGKTYRVHEFLSTGTSTLNVEVGGQMEYLIVAGGGGGGDRHGGGGGGGGFLSGSFSFNIQNYTITVGEGGTGGSWEASNTSPRGSGAPGSNSSISGVATSYGGGGGGTYDGNPSGTFGSGGGGGGNNRPGIAGTVGQGNSGGSGLNPGAGGGGGANSVGGDANNGSGGDGKEWPVGSGKYYAGGGGGAWSTSGGPATPGGTGGGGAGAWNDATIESGSPNTGGGGGGSRSQTTSTVGRPGGSGIVIVRYVVAERKLWTPSEISDLSVWLDANELTLNNNDAVDTWTNKGSGGNTTQSDSAKRPVFKTNLLNGKPGVDFDGSNDCLEISSLALNTYISVFIVAKTTTAKPFFVEHSVNANTNDGFFFYGSSNSHSLVRRSSGNGYLGTAGWFGSAAAQAAVVINSISSAPNPMGKVYKNGTLQADGSVSSAGGNSLSDSSVTASLFIGARNNTTTAAMDGDLHELIIYNAPLSQANREKVEGYLAHKWGLTNNLPSGHPYKYEPPYKVEPEEIVTDGLVLNLDAGDYASYPRSGTTWYDISGNGNNGTLTNGPTYDSANKGSIVFDGTNDYVAVGNDSSNQITTSLTLEAWVYPTQFDHTNIKEVIAKWDNRQYKLAIAGTIFGVPYGRFYIDVSDTGSNDNYRRSSSTLTLNSWNHIVGVYTSGASPSLNVYLNGTLDNGNLVGSVPSSIYNGTSPVYIGSHQGRAFKGNIANVRIYNRALSSTEVQQNFNALRGRYGV